jgi:transposase
VAECRDFLHRASTRLVRGNDVIVIEDLAVRNMVRTSTPPRTSWPLVKR